mgnify:CR=1 FL=1
MSPLEDLLQAAMAAPKERQQDALDVLRGRAKATVVREGSITLPATKLHDIARSLPDADTSARRLHAAGAAAGARALPRHLLSPRARPAGGSGECGAPWQCR